MSGLKGNFGFIGLGMMGYPMALNVRRKLPKSSTLYIYDLSTSALDRFVKEVGSEGEVVIASSAKEVVDNADTIITMLPEGSHVKSAFLTSGTGCLATTSESQKLFLDSSTIDAKSSLEVGEAVAKSGIGEFTDAPVSGGVKGAEAGTLAFMFGAPDSLVPRILPILALMGTPERLFHTGAPGSGLGAKLANNYLAGSIMIALSESMNMGIKMGLDAKKLAQIFSVSTSKNWLSENSNPIPGVVEHAASTRGYSGGFRLALCKKDIGLAVDAAKMVDARMVIGPTVLKCYEGAMENEEFRDKDCSIVYKWIVGQD